MLWFTEKEQHGHNKKKSSAFQKYTSFLLLDIPEQAHAEIEDA